MNLQPGFNQVQLQPRRRLGYAIFATLHYVAIAVARQLFNKNYWKTSFNEAIIASVQDEGFCCS